MNYQPAISHISLNASLSQFNQFIYTHIILQERSKGWVNMAGKSPNHIGVFQLWRSSNCMVYPWFNSRRIFRWSFTAGKIIDSSYGMSMFIDYHGFSLTFSRTGISMVYPYSSYPYVYIHYISMYIYIYIFIISIHEGFPTAKQLRGDHVGHVPHGQNQEGAQARKVPAPVACFERCWVFAMEHIV